MSPLSFTVRRKGCGDQGYYYTMFIHGGQIASGLPHVSLFTKTALVNCLTIGV